MKFGIVCQNIQKAWLQMELKLLTIKLSTALADNLNAIQFSSKIMKFNFSGIKDQTIRKEASLVFR